MTDVSIAPHSPTVIGRTAHIRLWDLSVLTKDNLLRAFATGRKCADQHPGIADAQPPASLAIPIAELAMGGPAYGITLIDPVAFVPVVHAEACEASGGEASESGDE